MIASELPGLPGHDFASERREGRDRETDVLRTVDRVLNLGVHRTAGDLIDLSREEMAETFRILADLFERGIVGYEYREINGEPQKVFIDAAIGSDAHRAPLVRDGRLDTYV